MPQIPFDPKFKNKSFFDFPKLKLKKGEKARVTVLEFPVAEFVHNLRKIILEDGQPVLKTETYGRDNDKERQVPEATFVGKFICLGNPEVLEKSQIDPDNCPACKASVENVSAVEAPKRRFVLHILKYQVKKGSFEVQQPFQAEVLAWELSENRFGQLVDINSEYGDIRKVDLTLGPCEIEAYQKYGISTGNGYTLSESDNLAKASEIIKANKADDLTPLLGRKVTPNELQSQVADILRMWDRGFGTTSSQAPGAAAPKGELDFTSFVQTPQAPAAAAAPAAVATEEAVAAPDLGSLATPQADPEPAAAPEPEEKPVSATTDVPDLDALLGSLGK